MQKINLYISKTQYQRLESAKHSSGISVAELIRRLIDYHLDDVFPTTEKEYVKEMQ